MRTLPVFILGIMLCGLGLVGIIVKEPQAKAAPVARQAIYQQQYQIAPAAAVFNREVGGPMVDAPIVQAVAYRHPNYGYRSCSTQHGCQQQYACNGCGNSGTVFYGWNGNGFPVARAGLRIVSFPVRAWLAWAPIRRLFGRC